MSDRYNPFGLPYLDRPVDTPNYAVDSRWPDRPSVADAHRMGGLAGTDQYAPTTYAPFDAYDRAQQAQHRDEKQQQAIQRSADVARGLSGQQGPADIGPVVRGMKMADMAGDMLAPDDVFGATTLLNPIRALGKAGRAVPAIAGAVLGSDTAEAGGARDPRLWSPISGTKLRKPLDEMEHRYTDVRVPVPRFVQPEDLVGGYGVFTPWDLSATNKLLTHVDNEKLLRPVKLSGGAGFQEANPGMAAASELAISRRLDNQAAKLTEETGKPVHIIPITMSPSGIDASHHVADPLSQMVQTAKITRKDATAFDNLMREDVPDWVGIKNKRFQDYINNLQGGMVTKALMADRMSQTRWQNKGFPDVAAIRHAASEPALIDQPRNTSGMTIARYTPGQGLLPTSHPSYPQGVAGQHMGQLASLLPFEKAAPDIAEALAAYNARNMALGKRASTPAYHFQKPHAGVPTAQYFDNEWADNVRRHWGERP
jgi:hypothetical protein